MRRSVDYLRVGWYHSCRGSVECWRNRWKYDEPCRSGLRPSVMGDNTCIDVLGAVPGWILYEPFLWISYVEHRCQSVFSLWEPERFSTHGRIRVSPDISWWSHCVTISKQELSQAVSKRWLHVGVFIIFIGDWRVLFLWVIIRTESGVLDWDWIEQQQQQQQQDYIMNTNKELRRIRIIIIRTL